MVGFSGFSGSSGVVGFGVTVEKVVIGLDDKSGVTAKTGPDKANKLNMAASTDMVMFLIHLPIATLLYHT